jgi:hypothetical protein
MNGAEPRPMSGSGASFPIPRVTSEVASPNQQRSFTLAGKASYVVDLGIDIESLHDGNLISGVVSGLD